LDPQQRRGAVCTIDFPMCTAQRGLNNLTLAHGEFIQRKFPISIQAGCSRRKTLNTNTTGQVKLKLAAFGQNHPTLNDILQLANVAGPIVALQFLHVELGQARTRNSKPAGGLFDKVISKRFHIFEALSQRRNFDGENAKTVIEVEAETPCFGLREEIAIGSSYETDLYRSRALVSHALKLPFLQNAQQLALQVERDFPDFIEKQGAIVSQLEAADTILDGASERTADMAEKLALE